MANELTITASALQEKGIDVATWSALKNSIYPGAKDESVMMALDYCRARQLDPLLKPVHLVPMSVKDSRTGKSEWRDVVMVQKAEKALKNAMEEDLLPPVIKLSVLLEAFIDDHAEQAREENWEFPDFRLIDSESVLSTEYKHFYFDKSKEGYSRYSSERSKYSLDNCLDMVR